MANRTIIARNLTTSDIYLEDLGINVPGSGQATLTEFSDTFAIQDDSELRAKVVVDEILLSFDGQNLNKDKSLDLLTPSALLDGYLGFFDQNQILYVGKHGDDANDGYTIDKAYLTFSAALAAASAAGPSDSNRFAVVCFDNGRYDERISVDAYVDVFAPNAILDPSVSGSVITVSTDTRIEFREVRSSSTGSFLAQKSNTSGIGPQLHIGWARIEGLAHGFINYANTTPGDWRITCEKISVVNGIAVGDLTVPNGDTTLDIEKLEILGNGFGIYQIGTGIIAGRVGQIIGTGTAIQMTNGFMDLSVGTLDCATAYNITSPAAQLTLFANRLSGAIIGAGASAAKVTIAGEAPEHADDHISNGSDLIDGDRLNIDFSPSFYSSDTSPAEVDDGYELTAHLAGIDGYFGNIIQALRLWKTDPLAAQTLRPLLSQYGVRLYNGSNYLDIRRSGGNAALSVGGTDSQALYFNCKISQTQLGGTSHSQKFAVSDNGDGPLLEVYADQTSRFFGDLTVDGYLQTGGNLLVADDGVSRVTVNGDLSVPSAAGDINGHRHYPPSSTDPSSPAPSDGDRYWNTTLHMEMRYDGSRSKWLSVESAVFQVGRSVGTPAGSYYRGINGLILSGSTGYTAFHDGTVVGIGYTRFGTASATFQVTANGTTIASLASTATSGKINSANGDFNEDDILAVRNASGGNQTTNVQAWIKVRWRA